MWPVSRASRHPPQRESGRGRVKDKAPLKGIRVIEWTSDTCSDPVGLAIAFAGRIAADLGATVFQIEASVLNSRQQRAPIVKGEAALSLFLDRGKHKISNVPDERDDLITVYVGDAGNAAIVANDGKRSLISVSGRANPPDVEDSEFTLLAVGGLLDLVGDPDRQPLRLGGHQIAYSAGLAIYAGIAAEICRRRAGAPPDVVRIGIADVAVWLNWKSVAMGSWSERVPTRLGDGAEWRTIQCADGWIALVYLEADWPKLKAIVRDERLDDPRYEDRLVRRREAATINAIVERAFASRTRAELRALALENRIPLGPVWTPAELEQDPQYLARDFLQRVPGSNGVATLQPALPVLWNGTRFGSTHEMEAAS
jgi:crotonobetainyl-CoA:carnitine CoA-transferase CaiB-like acyl-CoA transferase